MNPMMFFTMLAKARPHAEINQSLSRLLKVSKETCHSDRGVSLLVNDNIVDTFDYSPL
jgi:hypothetical protein